MKRDPPGLSLKELEFRALLADGPKYALWARRVREQWERDNIVWLHGYLDGVAVWKVEKPPSHVQTRPDLASNALRIAQKEK
jgi:hypothetical protein